MNRGISRGIALLALTLFGTSEVSAYTNQAHQGQGTNAKAAAEASAKAYLQELRELYQLPAGSDFSAAGMAEASGHFCRRYLQTFRSGEIVGSWVLICFTPEGEVQDKAAQVTPRIRIVNQMVSSLSDKEALRRAVDQMAQALGAGFGRVVESDVDQAWVDNPREEGLVGAFVVHLKTKITGGFFPEGRFVVYLDGVTGKMLAYENRVFNATGYGKVYSRDRFTTPQTEVLRLNKMLGLGRLASIDFVVQNDDGDPVSRLDGQYLFEPDQTEFDEVQAYYGLAYALERMQGWGYVQPFEQIPIHVHYGDSYANAFYDGDKIALGDGDGSSLLDLARDNTVVTHEYGHAVVDKVGHVKVVPWIGDGGMIHEGQADYLACAVYNYPSLGEGVMPDGRAMRQCDTRLPYSQRTEEVHKAGQVWSGGLWEVRQRLGDAVSDTLAMQLVVRIKSTGFLRVTTLMDAYRALVESDRALFAGAHKSTIEEIFREREFPLGSGFLAMRK